MRQKPELSDCVVAGTVLPAGSDSSSSDNHSSPGSAPSSVDSNRETHSLAQLLTNCRFFAGDDVEFSSLAESSASIRPGELVVYRIGRDCPAKLIADAMARGAAGILSEQVLPCPLPQCIVGDIELA